MMTTLTFKRCMALLSVRDYQTLYANCIEALQRHERDPIAFFFLGIVASDNGQHSKALEFFAKATELAPKNARYQSYHAKALMTLGDGASAKARADIAARLSTKDAFLADMLGTVYSRAGHHALALPQFKKAVQLNQKWALFQFNLGVCAQFLGDVDTARRAYIAATELDPEFYQAWYSRALLETHNKASPLLDSLKDIFPQTAGDADAQLLIGHAIAKILEDMGEFAESLDWLEKAKAAKRAQVGYDPAVMAQVCEAAKRHTVSRKNPTPSPLGQTPIFVLGLPRTGTTLIDRIISSHPDAHSVGELNLMSLLLKEATQTASHFIMDAQTIQAAQSQPLGPLAETYRAALQQRAPQAKFIIDKTPFNFAYAGLIHRAFPDAKIIAIRRGAMDSCLSNYRQLFASHIRDYHYSYDLAHTASVYRAFDDLMSHWRAHLPSDTFTEIHYEELVSDQETQTRRLLAFCGLEWNAACLNFHENTAAVDTASSVQVRQPLYKSSAGRWKLYGDRLTALKENLKGLDL